MRTLIITLLIILSSATRSQNTIHISGAVYDDKTKEPILYATIQLEGMPLGTVSNGDGTFELFLPEKYKESVLLFHTLGYEQKKLSLSEIKDKANIKVYLKTVIYKLPQVEIKPKNALEILQQAKVKIQENYSTQAYNFDAYYRELIQENDKYIKLAEGVCAFYYTPSHEKELKDSEIMDNYYSTDENGIKKHYHYDCCKDYKKTTFYLNIGSVFSNPKDRVKIIEARVSHNLSDMNPVISGGPLEITAWDITKYYGITGITAVHKQYIFELTDIIEYNNRQVYVISFKPKKEQECCVAIGSFYIDVESLAFVVAEFTRYPNKKPTKDNPLNESDTILYKCPYFKYYVEYKNIGKKWYLNLIKGESQGTYIYEKSGKIYKDFKSYCELTVNDIRTENIDKFNDNEIFKDTKYNIFYCYPLTYNEDFWNNYTYKDKFSLPFNIKSDLEINNPLEEQFKDINKKNKLVPELFDN